MGHLSAPHKAQCKSASGMLEAPFGTRCRLRAGDGAPGSNPHAWLTLPDKWNLCQNHLSGNPTNQDLTRF
jgi:hypothetical protein